MLTVVFDMDGVIFDTESQGKRIWEICGEKYGITDVNSIFIQCMGSNREQRFKIINQEMGNDFPAEDFFRDLKKLREQISTEEGIQIKKGVKSILRFLKQNKAKTAIASSTDYDVIVKEMSDADILQFFDVIVSGEQIRKSKPDPQIYLTACKKLEVRPDSEYSYAIEDSYNGVNSAFSAGMRTIMVPDIVPPNEEMKRKAFQIFPDLYAVQNYFEELLA